MRHGVFAAEEGALDVHLVDGVEDLLGIVGDRRHRAAELRAHDLDDVAVRVPHLLLPLRARPLLEDRLEHQLVGGAVEVVAAHRLEDVALEVRLREHALALRRDGGRG